MSIKDRISQEEITESKYSKLKVNNEIELCKVSDSTVKGQVEKALLKERISYYIRWEKAGLFAKRGTEICVFCINEWQTEAGEEAIRALGSDALSHVKFIKKKIDKKLF